MARQTQMLNQAITQVTTLISNSATSLTVDDGSVFPSEGDFYIGIDNEIMIVTARATNVLTISRSADSSASTSHAAGANVFAMTSAGQWESLFDDCGTPWEDWVVANRFLDSAGVTLTETDFTWINQDLASITDDTWGGITITAPATDPSVDEMRIKEINEPAGTYKITAHVLFGPSAGIGSDVDTDFIGLCLRDSTGGQLVAVGIRPDDVFGQWRFSDIDTVNSTQNSQPFFYALGAWVQIEYDGSTTYTFRCSTDGINFFDLGTETNGTYLTPDKVGFFFINNNDVGDRQGHFLAWLEE